MKTLKDVKPGDKVFVLNSNRGYLKEPQIETLTVNKVGILYIYTCLLYTSDAADEL